MRMIALVSVAILFAAAGCADSPEHKLEQARLALSSGQPEQALTLAQQVLKDRPGDITATLIVARANLRLRRYEASEKALKAMTAADPTSVEPNRELLNLALARMSDLLLSSEFKTSSELQDTFTAAKVLGHMQADWLGTTGKLLSEAEFGRARLIILDSQRIETLMLAEEVRLRNAAALNDPEQPVVSPAIEEMRRQIKAMRLVAEQHLANVYDADSNAIQALLKLNQLKMSRQAWDEVWDLARKSTRNPSLPAAAAVEMAKSILAIPEDVHPIATRLQLSQMVMDAVSKEARESPHWKIMSARLLLLDGRLKEANEMAELAYGMLPQDKDARFMLGWSLLKLQKYDRARTVLERLTSDHKDYGDAWTLYGLTLIQLGNNTLADDALRNALTINKDDRVARAARIGMIRSDQGTLSRSREDINRFYEENPTNSEAISFKLELEIASGGLTEVRKILGEVEKLPDVKPELREALVGAYQFVGNLAKAEEHAQELAQLRPESADDQLRLLVVQQRKEKSANYLASLQALHQRFPKHLGTVLTFGRELARRGQHDALADLMQKIRPSFPDSQAIRLMLAQAYMALSMTEESLEQIDAVLKANPRDVQAHELAARLHRLMGQPDIARDHLEQIDESQFSEEENPGALAHLKFAKQDYPGALRICDAAIAAGRADPLVRLIAAELKQRGNNDADAEAQLLALVRERPDDFSAYMALVSFYVQQPPERGLERLNGLRTTNEGMGTLAKGVLLSRFGRREEALELLTPAYRELVAKREKIAFSYARLIANLMMSRDPSKFAAAGEVFQALIDSKNQETDARFAQIDTTWKKPDDDATMARLAALAETLGTDKSYQRMQALGRIVRLGKGEAGLVYADRWLAENPANPEMHKAKGELLFALGRISAAATSFEEALKLLPDAVGTHERLVQALVLGRDFPAAEVALDRMAKVSKPARIYALWSKGSMFLELGLNRQAVESFELLVKENKATTDPRINYALGTGLAGLGQTQEAKSYLARIPAVAPQYPAAQIRMARLEQAASEFESAKSRLERLARDPRTAGEAVTELFRLSLSNRDDETLLAWSDKAVDVEKLSPQVREQWVALRANIQASAGDWKGVDQTLARALKQNADSARAIVMRILVLDHLGNRAEASALYKSAPQLSETELGVQIALGLEIDPAANAKISALTACLASIVRGDLPSARVAASRIGALNNTVYRTDVLALLDAPNSIFPARSAACRKLALAIAAMDAGLPQLAEIKCREVIVADPRLSPAHGLLLASQVRFRKPHDDDMKKAKAALPDTALAMYITSMQLAAAGDPTGAIGSTLAILNREPDHDHAMYRLCQLYDQTKEYAKTIALLEKLRSHDGGFRVQATNDLAFHLAEYAPERLEEAYGYAVEAAKAAPTSSVISDTVGWIEHLRGNDESALKILSLAMNSAASVSRHYHIGAVYHRLGKKTWACRHLEVAAAGQADDPDVKRAQALLAAVKGVPEMPR